jgi:[ribosomal protein S5]-alanine N-acetyltransferase
VVQIDTERFLLRELTEDDATERYLGWLNDVDAMRYIVAASQTKALSDLKRYVKEHSGRSDILFLGISEKETGLHIGNIKYEPVNPDFGYAVMGILIGEATWRGKGVGTEVLRTSATWLKENRNIKQILLGVHEDNIAGIKSYQKVGFVVADTPHIKKTMPGQMTMVWNM